MVAKPNWVRKPKPVSLVYGLRLSHIIVTDLMARGIMTADQLAAMSDADRRSVHGWGAVTEARYQAALVALISPTDV